MIENFGLIHMGEKWLEAKKQRMRNLLKIAPPDEALYREIMLSLGYPKNKVQFLELALLFPYREIKNLRNKEVIEKALLFRAGLSEDKDGLPEEFDISLRMGGDIWEYKGIRPANYPDKRIKGITSLLYLTTDVGITFFFQGKIKFQISNKNPRNALKNIMSFDGIGEQRKEEMFFNIISPFFMVLSEDTRILKFLEFLFENYLPLSDNKIIKAFKNKYKINITALKEYMGALYFMKEQGGIDE
jgi:hypothetical protein